MIKARIYRPAKNAMQSGKKKVRQWMLEFTPRDARFIDPIMGWTGSADTRQQLRLTFDTLEAAEEYAKRKGLDYAVENHHQPKTHLQQYSDNFTS